MPRPCVTVQLWLCAQSDPHTSFPPTGNRLCLGSGTKFGTFWSISTENELIKILKSVMGFFPVNCEDISGGVVSLERKLSPATANTLEKDKSDERLHEQN